MRIFYGLYVADERLAAALDLLRFLAEPEYIRRAHITVRGPYSTPQVESFNRTKGKTYAIEFEGIDSFLENRKQNTVFMKCRVPEIETIWDKPDYTGEIKAHITLYDGKNRTQAFTLLQVAKRYHWRFSAESTELRLIDPKSEAAEIEDFVMHQDLYDEILGRRIDYLTIQGTFWRDRLNYFERVADFIQTEFAS